ncbi:hypothetical protein [Falsiroseomonas oryziterrae]|uniref:hypothetical protein n=1 Tax=Falsiroseomonas oryziterrae TaxID=2911368 RepID=UPI001F17C391|nr:hypothetical protein [Roseomonas sp. NPKOSM-4]
MEHAAFHPQLSPQEIQEVGRLTINFGYAELLLDWLLKDAFQIGDAEASRVLITPLSTRHKMQLLSKRLPRCRNEEVKAILAAALKRLDEINEVRNEIIHGYWAFAHGAGGTSSFFRKNPAKSPITPSDVSRLADQLAVVTRDLYHAHNILLGQPLPLHKPHFLGVRREGHEVWFDALVPPPEPQQAPSGQPEND